MIRERAGFAGSIPALLVDGLAPGVEAGITTRERNFRTGSGERSSTDDGGYAELDAYSRDFGGWLRVVQVHGDRVLEGSGARRQAPDGSGGLVVGEADGIVLDLARWTGGPRLLTVTVADCVPVYLAWPGGYGLLHAGWRGIAAGVLEAGFRASGAAPEKLRVHFGPAIGGCCYEVGSEVVEALYGNAGGPAAARSGAVGPGGGDRWMLDLRHALAGRATACGVDPSAVSASGSCTACDGRFHSFRRDGGPVARRLMLAFIGRQT